MFLFQRKARWHSGMDHVFSQSEVDLMKIRQATRIPNLEILEALSKDPKIDPTIWSWAIRDACGTDYVPLSLGRKIPDSLHVEVVEFLLRQPNVHPDTDSNFPIKIACKNGNLEI